MKRASLNNRLRTHLSHSFDNVGTTIARYTLYIYTHIFDCSQILLFNQHHDAAAGYQKCADNDARIDRLFEE